MQFKLSYLVFIFSLTVFIISLLVYFSENDEKIERPLNNAIAVAFYGERLSSSDRLKDENIYTIQDKVVINVKNAKITRFADTNSMDPFLDKGSNGIEIPPNSPNDIKEGDIISYKSQLDKTVIIHRVIKIDKDEIGTYYIAKGDNNKNPDEEKIRFYQIEGILVGVLY